MRLLVVADGFRGGASFQARTLASLLAEREEVALMLIRPEKDIYIDVPGVKIILPEYPFKRSRLGKFVSELKTLRHAIKAFAPDKVLSFLNSVSPKVLLSMTGIGIPVIVSERNDPYADRAAGKPFNNFLWWLSYHKADHVIYQFDNFRKFFPGKYRQRRTSVVPNIVLPTPVKKKWPAPLPQGQDQGQQQAGPVRLIAVSALAERKRIDRLLNYFAAIHRACPQTELSICGDGPLRDLLEIHAETLGIRGSVSFEGNVDDVQKRMARSDIFLMTSDREGFPNALVEAMSVGLPCVMLKCHEGLSEIIRHGYDGYLPESDESFIRETIRLCRSEKLRRTIGGRAGAVADKFSPEKILPLWRAAIGLKGEVAVIFEENMFDRKGAFNAKTARAAALTSLVPYTVDTYLVQTFYGPVERLLLGWRKSTSGIVEREEREISKMDVVTIDGLTVRIIPHRYSILDHFLFYKLKLRPVFFPRFLKKCADIAEGYKVVTTHSLEGGIIGMEAQRRFGIPFFVTWHGSDIHTKPYKYPCIKALTAEIIKKAALNFFVSQDLLTKSENIGPGRKEVLYNAASKIFYTRKNANIDSIKKGMGVSGKRVVTFAGNLIEIKNADLLPDIFKAVAAARSDVAFVIAGDGKLLNFVESRTKDLFCVFLGSVEKEEMPLILNMTDVLILPSKNEGLPLVVLEAQRCSAAVVASRVGGIPEVLPDRFTVMPGPEFVKRFSDKVIQVLDNPPAAHPERVRSWDDTAREEALCYEEYV